MRADTLGEIGVELPEIRREACVGRIGLGRSGSRFSQGLRSAFGGRCRGAVIGHGASPRAVERTLEQAREAAAGPSRSDDEPGRDQCAHGKQGDEARVKTPSAHSGSYGRPTLTRARAT